MNGREKSDPAIIAMKPPNGAGRPAEEAVERRAGAEGNAGRQSTHRAQNRERVTQALDRVRQVRRQTPEVGAVCGKAARTVLCGGRPVMGVPTAIRNFQRRFAAFLILVVAQEPIQFVRLHVLNGFFDFSVIAPVIGIETRVRLPTVFLHKAL